MGKDRPLLLTRPRAQSERFLGALESALARPVAHLIAPIIEIEHLQGDVDTAGFEGVIFTSENAVPAARRPAGPLPALCVGQRTAAAAQAAGFDVRAAGASVAELRDLLARQQPAGRWLHLRGAETTLDLVEALAGAGVAVSARVVYRQVEQELDPAAADLLARGPAIVPLFSARSASRLRAAAGPIAPDIRVIALSPKVAEAWGETGVSVADRADAEAMQAAVMAELSQHSSC